MWLQVSVIWSALVVYVTQGSLSCAANESCILTINASTSSWNDQVTCPVHHPCTITCSNHFCDGMTINATSTNSQVTFICDNSDCQNVQITAYSTDSLSVICRNSMDEGRNGGCNHMTIDAVSTYAVSFICKDSDCSDTSLNVNSTPNVTVTCNGGTVDGYHYACHNMNISSGTSNILSVTCNETDCAQSAIYVDSSDTLSVTCLNSGNDGMSNGCNDIIIDSGQSNSVSITCSQSDCTDMIFKSDSNNNLDVTCNGGVCDSLNINSGSINTLSVACNDGDCSYIDIDVDWIDNLSVACNGDWVMDDDDDIGCGNMDINSKESNIVSVSCHDVDCRQTSIDLTQVNNVLVKCEGADSCDGISITADIYDNTAQCQSDTGFHILCDGENSCRGMQLTISSIKSVYNSGVTDCALQTASVICIGRSSCDYGSFIVDIFGDLDISCDGRLSCYCASFYYNPPLSAKNIFHLECRDDEGCGQTSIVATTASQLVMDCIPTASRWSNGVQACNENNIVAPIVPFLDHSGLTINGGNVKFSGSSYKVNSDSIVMNCNGFGCYYPWIDAIFGDTQITYNKKTQSCMGCFDAISCGFDYRANHCGSDEEDEPEAVLNRLAHSNIIVPQAYDDGVYTCETGKNCFIYGVRSNNVCNDDSCGSITCAADTTCTILSLKKFAFSNSIISAKSTDSLILFDEKEDNGFSNSTIHLPENGEFISYGGYYSFENSYLYGMDLDFFLLHEGVEKLRNAVLHLENVKEARFGCTWDRTCSNAKIYITNDDGIGVPYDRFCFDCKAGKKIYDEQNGPPNDVCENITLHIDDNDGNNIECITHYDVTKYEYYCYGVNDTSYRLNKEWVKYDGDDYPDPCHTRDWNDVAFKIRNTMPIMVTLFVAFCI